MTAAKVANDARPWGAYVHFPWCLKKCPYCDFLSIPVEPQRLTSPGSSPRRLPRAPLDAPSARQVLPHEAYADAVLWELEARLPGLNLTTRPASIFFGGGTPSLWAPEQLGRVVTALSRGGPPRNPAPGAARGATETAAPPPETPALEAPPLEVTVECNPTSFDEEHARRLVDVGVNRISLGVQSLDPGRLEFLGRLHDPEGALQAIAAARRAGVPRVSADLIFGVAGQTPEQAAAEVRRLAATGVTHLSAYALTIESNTHFGTLARRGQLPLLDEGLVAESFRAVDEALEAEGFLHYEISNYAREEHFALHNLGYWRGHDYLGLGTGAWGTVRLGGGSRLRYRNTPSVERYLESWTGQSSADPYAEGRHLADREPIDPETELRERLLLGLRLRDGLDTAQAEAEVGVELWSPRRRRARDKLLRSGRLAWDGVRLWIPPDQWLFADGIIADLL